jgi:hypothetical protein
LSLTQTWNAGGKAGASSRLQVMISMRSPRSGFLYVSGEPHVPQKLRVTGREERKSTGLPRVIAN